MWSWRDDPMSAYEMCDSRSSLSSTAIMRLIWIRFSPGTNGNDFKNNCMKFPRRTVFHPLHYPCQLILPFTYTMYNSDFLNEPCMYKSPGWRASSSRLSASFPPPIHLAFSEVHTSFYLTGTFATIYTPVLSCNFEVPSDVDPIVFRLFILFCVSARMWPYKVVAWVQKFLIG